MNMKQLIKTYPLVYGANNPLLRTMSKPIDSVDQELRVFAEALAELTREYEWVWLSAPQIGKNIRIISVTKWKNSKRGTKCNWQTIMINPELIKRSDKLFRSHEWCLSLPGEYGDVLRHETIVVRYMGIDEKYYEQKLKHFNAAIVQHEIDHLDGVLFVDKLIR